MPNQQRRSAYLMLVPYLMGLIGLILGPALLTLGLVFTRFDALREPVWIGFTNFVNLIDDRFFWIALGNTLFYLGLAVVFRIGGALLLALLLQHRRGQWLAALVFSPSIIPDIAYALIWLVAFNPRFGPINLLLGLAGLPTPAWLIEPWPARLALILMATWQLGEGFIVLLASLQEMPARLYDAAAIDGASAWDRFRYITWPLLLPRLTLLTARDLIISLQTNFVPSLVMTNGGPGYATLFLPLYVYFLAFDDLRFGYAASVVWTLYLITILVVAGQSLLSRRWAHRNAFSDR